MAGLDFTKLLNKEISDREIMVLYTAVMKEFQTKDIKDIVAETAGLDKLDNKAYTDKERRFGAFANAIGTLMAKAEGLNKKMNNPRTPEKDRFKLNEYLLGNHDFSEFIEANKGQKINAVAFLKQKALKLKSAENTADAASKMTVKASEKLFMGAQYFQNIALTDIIGRLNGCKTFFRNSSKAFEDILETAGNMQKIFTDKAANDAARFIASKSCAETLIAKMEKYIEDRNDIAIKYGPDTDNYKGKRVHTMMKMRDMLKGYLKNLTPEIKKISDDMPENCKEHEEKEAKIILKDVYKNAPFDEKIYNSFAGHDITKHEMKLLKEAYGEEKLTCSQVSRVIDKYHTFRGIVKLNFWKDPDKTYRQLENLSAPDRMNLTAFDSMFDETVTMRHITGDFYVDRVFQKDAFRQVKDVYKTADPMEMEVKNTQLGGFGI